MTAQNPLKTANYIRELKREWENPSLSDDLTSAFSSERFCSKSHEVVQDNLIALVNVA